ncbi:hypothetical protein BJ170DRAFT_40313 [Xylariales sp. AK1849]|nr:hypothetical protein BJ170DRAFT_40313 [Xylariales sp. AK1849]
MIERKSCSQSLCKTVAEADRSLRLPPVVVCTHSATETIRKAAYDQSKVSCSTTSEICRSGRTSTACTRRCSLNAVDSATFSFPSFPLVLDCIAYCSLLFKSTERFICRLASFLRQHLYTDRYRSTAMAEVIGVVASGIAVVQLAAGVSQALVKLKSLWDEIKDVPEGIEYLMEEIEVLQLALGDIETDVHRQETIAHSGSGPPFPSIQPILRYCQSAEHSLSELVYALNTQIKSSRTLQRGIGKVRVVLKKDILQGYERRLQRAISLLTLANQEYMKDLMSRQLSAVHAVVVKTYARHLPPCSPVTAQNSVQANSVSGIGKP